MPLYQKLRDALQRKQKDPTATLPVARADQFQIPGTGTFQVLIKDWGSLNNPTPAFDGLGVRSTVSSLVEYQGTDHSFGAYGKIFYELLNSEFGLRKIRAFSICGISSPGGQQEYYGLLHIQAHCERSAANAPQKAARQSPERQPAPPSPAPAAPPPVSQAGPPQAVTDDAIKGLQGLGFGKREAAAMVAGIEAQTAEELIQKALKAHGQSQQKKTSTGKTERRLHEQGIQGAQTIEDPAGGAMAPGAGVPTDLKDGVWYHIPTHRDFPIDDDRWSASPNDAPILALGHNLTRVLNADNKAAEWYDENPPPMRPKEPAMYPAYARAMRSYLKKLALQAIENWGWILFWHGYLYTNGTPLNFAAILELGNSDFNKLGRSIPDNHPIAVMDANNNRTLIRTTWGALKTSRQVTAAAFGVGRNVTTLRQILRGTGDEMLREFPALVVRDYTAESLKLALFRALCETTLLMESLTYNQMLTATARYWRTRLRTVRAVHTQPPALVMMQDGTVDLAFNFESRPSTEGRPHRGYVKFISERGGTNWLAKLKDMLGKAAKNIQRLFGHKVPPQILKGSDLRKMLVEVSCDCKDFKYRMSWANVKAGVTTAQGRTDNGAAPLITNPQAHPGFCKHILATVRYLTDDAELTVSQQFSRQQQEALARDRARFMREAETAYEEMPETPEEAELEKPEEEEPEAAAEFQRLAEPPKPITPAEPPTPAAPQATPAPSYQSLQ